ncbi:hypothetical protein QQX98_003375 [Neonectria punicea]|uniref:Zn(2)-C6 fungal-type domain-containing protein n=1 Tax=Neonectria punicea TaxID=979145 RepID=A0ABR1HE17_9HYPO
MRALGMRWTAVLGVSVMGGSEILSSFAVKNIGALFFTSGVLMGTGVSLVSVVVFAVIAQWFSTRRGLANGLMFAGAGFGGATISFTLDALIQRLNIAWGYRILGLLTLATGLPAAWVIKERVPTHTPGFIEWRLFNSFTFVLVFLASALGTFPLFVPPFFLPMYTKSLGFSSTTGAGLVAGFNLASAFGRIACDFACDKFGSLNTLFISLVLTAVSMLAIWPSSTTLGPMILFVLVNGVSNGGFFSTMPTVVSNVFGSARVAIAMSMILTGWTGGYLMGAPIAGYLLEAYGGAEAGLQAYRPAMFYAGSLALASGGMVATVRLHMNRSLWAKLRVARRNFDVQAEIRFSGRPVRGASARPGDPGKEGVTGPRALGGSHAIGCSPWAIQFATSQPGQKASRLLKSNFFEVNRVAMGCRVCRARKVKCDGRPNGCRNCERLQLECVDDEGSKSGRRSVPVSLRKIRTYRSCTNCRISKTKCDGDRPKCSRCSARNLECLYDGGSAPRWARNLSKAPTSASTDDGGRNTSHESSVAMEDSMSPSLVRSRETDDTRSDLQRSSTTDASTTNPPVDFADDTELSIHSWFYALSLNAEDQAAKSSLIRSAGNLWAKKAELLVLTNFGKISIQRLMTCVLLYDFHFRLGEYTQALMLSGLAVRMAHALQVNIEYSPDILCAESNEGAPPAVEKESRRRLMWACYILDAWTGSGVDQLTLLREADIKIQLPCNERNFRLRIPCVTETLGVGHVLQFLPPAIVPRRPAANMGIMAYYIRIVTLWKRVVRYVKHLDTSPPPWIPESDFVVLDADLQSWGRHLPEFISYSPDTIYARLESDQLGSLVLLHCTFHHTLLDLYRISMPDLFKLRKPFYFPPNQQEFLRSLQADCFHHARQIASILAEAVKHGTRLVADSLLPCFAYDSSRVMLYYIARLLDLSRPDAEGLVTDAIDAVESNSKILRTMSALFPLADSLATTTERWLCKIRLSFSQDEEMSDACEEEDNENERSPDGLVSPTQNHPGNTIAGLGITRSARNEACDTKPEISTLAGVSESGSPTINRAAGRRLPGSLDESPARSGLQHEQPVALRTPPATMTTSSAYMRDHAVDLSDLQNYLSWDMYGIMEMSDSGLKAGIEGNGYSMPSWSGAM